MMAHSIVYRRILTRMGYYNYQNNLIFRHLNQEGGWDDHLRQSRQLILKAIDLYKPRKISVLGSGWLLEMPLAEIINRVEKICLVDIVHPPAVIDQTAGIKNIELVYEDLTGGLIEEVWDKTHKYSILKKLKSLESIRIKEYVPETDPGMVISLNILTQLESLIIDFLKKRSRIPEDELNTLKRQIQKNHIDFLIRYNSVLVSDISEIITSKSGIVTTNQTMLTELPQCKFSEEWAWNFDPHGDDYYNKRSKFKVIGLII